MWQATSGVHRMFAEILSNSCDFFSTVILQRRVWVLDALTDTGTAPFLAFPAKVNRTHSLAPVRGSNCTKC